MRGRVEKNVIRKHASKFVVVWGWIS